MNKRQAEIIMQLPDGYDWEFFHDSKFIAGIPLGELSPDKPPLLYEIKCDELIQRELNNKIS